jgi:nickel-dependent lactate racemase
MLKKFSLNYGKTALDLELPARQVLYEIKGTNAVPIEDVATSYRHALDHPIDAPPLKERLRPGHKVAIIVSDITRAWQRNDITLPVLLDYLNDAGVPDDQVTIVIGVGAHRQNTQAEFIELCSKEVCHRVRVVNHDCWDDHTIELGKTSRGTEVAVNPIIAEADRVIMTGGVIYHYMAGFGGGRKSILPGVAAIKTIQQNHLLALTDTVGGGSNPQCASGITRGNPLHEDMMEIAAFVNPDFIVNVVPNLDGRITGIFAGNWVSACEMVKQMEYKDKGTIILVTRPENFALARQAHLEPAADMKAALELAYQRGGPTKPTITVMPQGANTFPIVVP